MAELKRVAFSRMSDFCTWTNRSLILKSSAAFSPELLAAVESVAETSDKDGGKLMKIKLHSKLQAISHILKLYELSEIEARLAVLEEKAGLK
jgi:hypothetical protein